ncbi:hypothetical protein EV648_116152 [Kribbella sp. VKM Ac-2568]|nr:hypothetical protein EV648_116152 [Kribbella sp. VKM Ac-2568]
MATAELEAVLGPQLARSIDAARDAGRTLALPAE